MALTCLGHLSGRPQTRVTLNKDRKANKQETRIRVSIGYPLQRAPITDSGGYDRHSNEMMLLGKVD